MSNLEKSSRLLQDWADMHSVDMDMYHVARKLLGAGLLVPDAQVIRTMEELEALALEDADAIVLASEAGVVRTVRALWEMYRFGGMWGLPAVVIATVDQVRAAREAMEQDNE